MTSKLEQIETLSDYVMIEASIQCDECGKGTVLSEFEPEEDAYADGFRIIDDKCLCKKCRQKLNLKTKPKK